MLAQILLLVSTFSMSIAAPSPMNSNLQPRAFSAVDASLKQERTLCGDLVNALFAYNGTGATLVPEIQAYAKLNNACNDTTNAATSSSAFTTAQSKTLLADVVDLEGCFSSVIQLFGIRKPQFESEGFKNLASKEIHDLRSNCVVLQSAVVLKKTATAQKAAVSSSYAKDKARFDAEIKADYP